MNKAGNPGVGCVCIGNRCSQGKMCNFGPLHCIPSTKLHTHCPFCPYHSKVEYPLQVHCAVTSFLKIIDLSLYESVFTRLWKIAWILPYKDSTAATYVYTYLYTVKLLQNKEEQDWLRLKLTADKITVLCPPELLQICRARFSLFWCYSLLEATLHGLSWANSRLVPSSSWAET